MSRDPLISTKQKRYILDTCIFNWLLDTRITIENLPSDGAFVATHIQRAELSATPDDQRRQSLLSKFESVGPEVLPCNTFVCDVAGAGFDQAKMGDGQVFTALKTALDVLKQRGSNTQDALIAEVALLNEMTLVTADKLLSEVAQQHGIEVVFFTR